MAKQNLVGWQQSCQEGLGNLCGIGGFRKFGDTPITRENVDTLLIGLEQRGNDATGIAIMRDDNQMWVLKNDEPAWKFVNCKGYDDLMKEHLDHARTIILHTRFASVGSPRINKNNHPMFKDKTAVVHNGGINNHEWLFGELKLERAADTDSDILRAILDKEGFTKKGIRVLNKCSGPAAIAAITPDQPEHLLLARSGSPLVCAKYGDLLVWASEKHYIHKAMRPWEKWKNLDFQQQKVDIAFLTMADDSAWLFGPDGVEWHDQFKTCMNQSQVAKYRPTYSGFSDRKKRWNNLSENEDTNNFTQNEGFNFPELVWCKGCGRKHKFTDTNRKRYHLWDFKCSDKNCAKRLDVKPS